VGILGLDFASDETSTASSSTDECNFDGLDLPNERKSRGERSSG
jgi:hypothetical protein